MASFAQFLSSLQILGRQSPPPQPLDQDGSGLVPEFDLSIPATGDDLGGLVGVPQDADAHLVMGLDTVVQLGGLPIPDVQFPVCISRHHVARLERWGGGGGG